MAAYLIASTITFFLLGMIWERKNALNLLLKVLFGGLFVSGFLLTCMHFGFVVRH